MKLRSGSHVTDDPNPSMQQKVTNPKPTTEEGSRNGDDWNILGYQINKVVLIVHVNICIYATCFFIQIGALPVSYQLVKCAWMRNFRF